MDIYTDSSKLEKIRDWVATCPLLINGSINVDYLGDKIYSYSIDRTPNALEYTPFLYGGGKRQITFDFTCTFPYSTKAVDNLVNSKFGEDFEKWVYGQNVAHNLPDIDGAFKIECTTPAYILQKSDTVAVYIIQFRFVYYEI